MARRSDYRPARSLTAAAITIDPSRASSLAETRKRPLPWQRKGFEYYDRLGELRYAMNWKAQAMSRLRIVPALVDENNGIPIPLDQTEGVTDFTLEACRATLARLENSQGGSQELMRGLGLNIGITGEAYLVARQRDHVEEWTIESVLALVVDDRGRLAIKPTPWASTEEYEVLEDDSLVIRIMTRHPAYSGMPDSALHAALGTCEDLLLLTSMVRASASSRMPSGALFIPEEASFGSPDPTTDEGDGMETEDPLTRDLIQHFTTPISDPNSAAAVVPFLIRMAREDIAAVRYESFERTIDSVAMDWREEARNALAAAVDLPAEVLTGKADVNHWTAWEITEEAFRLHVEPAAISILDALTAGYFRPALAQMGVEDVNNYQLWYDNSELVSHPDAKDRALDAYDRGEVTGAYLRTTLAIPEEAMPDEEEIQRRITLRDALNKSVTLPSDSPADATDVTAEPPEQAITAAIVKSVNYRKLSLRLGRIESGLSKRLLVAVNAEMRRALERAGSRIRSATAKDKTGMTRNTVASVLPINVAQTLGPAMVSSLGLTNEDLLAEAFSGLKDQWDSWVKRAQEEGLRAVNEELKKTMTAATEDDFYNEDAIGRQQEEDRDTGWLVLLALLLARGAKALYEPTAPTPISGEFGGHVVPPSLVASALKTAGGGALSVRGKTGNLAPDAVAEGFSGVLSGNTMGELLQEAAGLEFGNAFIWEYGDAGSRQYPYYPHESLDQVEFSSWDSDELGNNEDWPSYSHFFPGDHEYCQCSAYRLVEGEDLGFEEIDMSTGEEPKG